MNKHTKRAQNSVMHPKCSIKTSYLKVIGHNLNLIYIAISAFT